MQDLRPARSDNTEGLIYTGKHGAKNIHTMDGKLRTVKTKGEDKRSERLNALGILLYINTKTHGETQNTTGKDG